MVTNCFDIESCVNAFLEPQFFCRRRMSRKKRVFSSAEAGSHMPGLAPAMEGQGGWKEPPRCFSAVVCRARRPWLS